MGKRIVFHYHENASAKGKVYIFLAKCMQWLADDIICVSKYQSSNLSASNKIKVIPNSLPLEFTEKCIIDKNAHRKREAIPDKPRSYESKKQSIRSC